MLKLFSVLLALSLPVFTYGAKTIQLTDTKKSYYIPLYAEKFFDKSKKLTIQEISSPKFNQWQKADLKKSYGNKKHVVLWLKFKANSKNKKANWFLNLNFPQLEKVDLFFKNNEGKWINKKSGRSIPLSLKDLAHRNVVFDFPEIDQETEYYLRIETESLLILAPMIYDSSLFNLANQKDYLFFGLTIGFMAMLILYNLFLAFFLRNFNYFLYSIAIGSHTAYYFMMSGIPYQLLDSYEYNSYLVLFLLALTSLNFAIFTRTFLQTKNYSPILDKIVFIYIIASSLVIILQPIVSYYIINDILIIISLSNLLVFVVISLVIYLKGYSSAKYYTFAWLFQIIGTFISGLALVGILEATFFSMHAHILGGVLTALFFSLALADSINVLRKEKERAQGDFIKQLKRVGKLKDIFLTNTSHELRTPLNGIIGIAENMLLQYRNVLSQEQFNDLKLIATSGKRLYSLVNDLLDYSLIKNEDLKLNFKAVDLHTLTNLVFRICESYIGQKKLILKNEIPSNFYLVYADEDRLQQILLNLVHNAIKFTVEGEVRVSALLEHQHIIVTVSDTGIGIPKEKHDEIFLSFEQLSYDIQEYQEGIGVGLAISKSLVELHGGQIWVKSQPGMGSKFSFSLRMNQNEKNDEPIQILEDNIYSNDIDLELEKKEPSNNSRIKILAVDDDPINLHVLTKHLNLEGFNVIKAFNGNEALYHLKSNKDIFLVLLDIIMPGLSGFEVCQKIRMEYKQEELPVLFLTAKNRPSDIEKAFEYGGNDYVTKPIAKNELIARINVHLTLQNYIQALKESENNISLLNIHIHNSIKNKIDTVRSIIKSKFDFANQSNESLETSDIVLINNILEHCNSESNNILYTINNRDCTIKELFSEIEFKLQIASQLNNLTYDTIKSFNNDHLIVDSVDVQGILDIFSELSNNSIKYVPDTEVRVEMDFQDNFITLLYEDNSPGYDLDDALNKKGSYGLKIIKKIAKQNRYLVNFDTNRKNSILLKVPYQKSNN